MRVNYIFKLKLLSDQLIEVEAEIEPAELVVLMRHLANKLCEPGNLYLGHGYERSFTVKDEEKITRDDFITILSRTDHKSIANVIDDRHTMADLQLIEELHINSTTRKSEVIARLCQDEDILFEHFRNVLLQAFTFPFSRVSDASQLEVNGFQLVFRESQVYGLLPGTSQIEFWKLISNGYHSYGSERVLHLDIKDVDSQLINKMEHFVHGKSDRSYDLNPDPTELISNAPRKDSLRYRIDMYHLQQDFGLRRGSKKATFIEGLKRRKNLAVVKQMMGKQLMISIGRQPSLGQPLNKETFEQIALHLRLMHINGSQLICKVIDKESEETLHAIWHEERIEIYPTIIELGGEKK